MVKNTDKDGDILVGAILDIIDKERSRYAVAVATAHYIRKNFKRRPQKEQSEGRAE